MNIASLTRDASVVLADLTYVGTDVMTKSGCRIYVPTRFDTKELSKIGSEIWVVGVYAIVIGNNYAVMSALAMMRITPRSLNIIKINGEEYYEFVFGAGDVVISNAGALVKSGNLVYRVYDEIVAKGHVPWYLDYEDMGKLFVTSEYHGGMRLAATNATLEMIVAAISRSKNDKTIYYRHDAIPLIEKGGSPYRPTFIALRNIVYGATNTTARLMGSYFDDGVVSSLVNESERKESIESLLRGVQP